MRRLYGHAVLWTLVALGTVLAWPLNVAAWWRRRKAW